MTEAVRFDLRHYLDAWRSLQPARILPLYAENVEIDEPLLSAPLQGHKDLEHAIRSYSRLVAGASELKSSEIARQGPDVAWQGRWRVVLRERVEDTVPGEGGRVPGKRVVEVETTGFLTLNDEGRIEKETLFYDTLVVARELEITVDDLKKIRTVLADQ